MTIQKRSWIDEVLVGLGEGGGGGAYDIPCVHEALMSE